MLAELNIKSFGIIDELSWELGKGFNAITGETGAGKSLVIDAIEALLNGRLDEEHIRFGDDIVRVAAVFSMHGSSLLPFLRSLLENNGILADEDDFLISCEFRRHGRTVMRINGSAVTRALLREVGALLIDVHAQSQHLSLFDRREHLNYLDSYAGTTDKRDAFAESATSLYEMQDELSKLLRAETERAHRQEILRYQYEEVSRAKLKDGEEEDLGRQRCVMQSCEKLKALAYEAYQALNGDDDSTALSRANKAMRAVNGLVALDRSQIEQVNVLKAAIAMIEEVARSMCSYEEGLEYDTYRLEEIENRLEFIHALKKKYGATVEQVLQRQQLIEAEMLELDSVGEAVIRLADDITKQKAEMAQKAQIISRERKQAATRMEKAVERELSELGMEHVRFSVQITQKETSDGLPCNDKIMAFAKYGVDNVEFMVATNLGEPFKPLTDIASTGEVSRFTLALKAALAEADATPVIIFDEIDIGVGGRSGDIIGKKLWGLARHHQVICVTHLPQIAVYAEAHFNVSKITSGERTTSTIDAMTPDARINELAAMLGGAVISETAHMNAAELSEKAIAWISAHG